MSEFYSIREFADKLRAVIEQYKNDKESLRSELLKVAMPFIYRPDLFELGVKRPGNHIDNSKYIYYDGQLSVTIDQLPKDLAVPAHGHGNWEALIILKGSLHHKVYDRLDDRSVEGCANLKCIDDKVFRPMQLAMVIPPAEIHAFTAQEKETFIMTIAGGNYATHRNYYDIEAKTYQIAVAGTIKPKNMSV